ncbi:LytTR family transcriptional regulator DNA-binding domain-containing protein [uncultured Croceitalea sp.]|uniref:LytR/AlgR family response regulator transcription factor n=1 Tax=uncultured Croceitalea sp. TaxID=1798908 RepID=UPI00330638F5
MIGEIKKVKLLVVEDEIILAQDISQRLTAMNYEVVGIADSAKKALALLTEHPDVDLLLLDIILKGDQDGIELARSINTLYGIPFIFLTSHADQYLVERAKSVQPYAYILKPFNDRQVSVAIEMALVNYSKKTPETSLLNSEKYIASKNQVLHINDSLFLKKDHYFERVLINEILYLEADGNYTTINTQCGRFVYSTVLKKVESLLPTNFFLRVHRSFVVNIKCISGFEGNLLYIGKQKIPVSKSYHEQVFQLFKRI